MIEHTVNTMKWSALLLALALAPAAALAEPPTTRLDDGGGARYQGGRGSLGAPVGAWSFSPQIALSIPDEDLDVGPRFTLEGMYAVTDFAPPVRFDIGFRGSFAYHPFGDYPFGGSFWVFDALPDAKIRFAPSDRIGLYGDFGAGVAVLHWSFDPGIGGGSATRAAATFQFGFGAAFALTPGLNLTTEVRFNFYTHTRYGGPTLISLPTIGLEFF